MTDGAISSRALRSRGFDDLVRLPLPRQTSLVLFGLLPAVVMIMLLRTHGLGWDFRAFYNAGRDYLAGKSPYPGHSLAALADKQEFVYPAPIAALFVPFAVLPYSVALSLWLVGSVAAIAACLLLLGVRDWRCFGALFLTHPIQQSVRLGTMMPVLMLLLGLIWKYRDRLLIAASLSAFVALAKVFLFPVLIWFAVTRRLKTALIGSALAGAICLLGWLPINLATIASYPSLLQHLARYEETFSYSLTSFGVAFGLSPSVATTIAVVTGAALLCWAAAVGRSSEYLAFRLVLAASFVFSPIVWGHYFALLVVPLALSWPRLSPIWLAPIWIKSDTLELSNTPAWIALALVVMLVQLNLAFPVARRWIGRVRVPGGRAVGLGVIALLLIATEATAKLGQTRDVTLDPSRGGLASGAGSFRIDRPHARLCWRLWTDALPPGRAVIAITGDAGQRSMLLAEIGVERNGQAQGCVRLAAKGLVVADGLASRPTHYRLTVSVPRVASIAGTFRNQ